MTGSSPLTRGKLAGDVVLTVHLRLIPAHAGKTLAGPPRRQGREAHPRSRGENRLVYSLIKDDPGSSPLTRGKPCSMCRRASSVGLIPAHAGKTRAALGRAPATQAHPRSRGENESRHSDNPEAVGSSPLTRGKLGAPTVGVIKVGLIPAHAGKT